MIQANVTNGENLRSFRTSTLALTETRHPAGMKLPRHAHRHACINFILEGVYDEGIAGVSRTHGPLSLVFKPAQAEHANHFELGSARCLLVELLDERLAPESADLSAPCESRDARAASAALALWAELAGAPNPLAVEAATAELYERVLGERETFPIEGRSPALRTVTDLLCDDPSTPWTLSKLAAQVGRHPSHLARSFRARHGTSIGEYLQHLRVAAAAQRLAHSDEPIASVAQALGFADQSHLTRTFRQRLGRTPGAYRRLMRVGVR